MHCLFKGVEIGYYLIFFITFICSIIDIKWRRIPNILTIPLYVIGICYGILFLENSDGLSRLVTSLLIFLVFLIPFYMKLLGAGDVKLFMCIAIWLPSIITVKVIVVTLLIFLIYSLAYMGLNKSLGFYIKKHLREVKIMVYSKNLYQVENLRRKTVPFALFIFLSFLVVCVYQFFQGV